MIEIGILFLFTGKDCIIFSFPATGGLFSFAFAGLSSTGMRPLPWVEPHFDATTIHNLGRDSSYLMPHDTCMFADCELSLLCPAHSFKVIPLLLIKYHVRIQLPSNRRACSTQ